MEFRWWPPGAAEAQSRPVPYWGSLRPGFGRRGLAVPPPCSPRVGGSSPRGDPRPAPTGHNILEKSFGLLNPSVSI